MRYWSLQNLPVFPAAGFEALRLLEDPEVGAREIARALRREPSLSARLLAHANSAFYGMNEAKDIDQAITRIGTEKLKRLLPFWLVQKTFLQGPTEVLDRCWANSIAVAVASETVAREVGEANPAEAYAAGLLHDLGRLGLFQSYPEAYTEMLETIEDASEPYDPLQAERALFDVDHCEAGAWMSDHWGLPKSIAEAAQTHHDEICPSNSIAAFVYSGCYLADQLGYREPMKTGESHRHSHSPMQYLDKDVWARLRAALDQVRRDVVEISGVRPFDGRA